MKNLLTLLLFALLLASCRSTAPVTEIIYKDSVHVREIPRIVRVPGDTLISRPINIDSLAALLRAGVPPSVIEKITIREDPVTRNRVGILIDELGNLTAICEIQEKQINLLDKEITRLTQEIQNTTIIEKPGFFQRIKDSLDLLVYTTLIILAALFVIKRLLP
jgi:hypothetical protein